MISYLQYISISWSIICSKFSINIIKYNLLLSFSDRPWDFIVQQRDTRFFSYRTTKEKFNFLIRREHSFYCPSKFFIFLHLNNWFMIIWNMFLAHMTIFITSCVLFFIHHNRCISFMTEMYKNWFPLKIISRWLPYDGLFYPTVTNPALSFRSFNLC
jgi:hypothetical protein